MNNNGNVCAKKSARENAYHRQTIQFHKSSERANEENKKAAEILIVNKRKD